MLGARRILGLIPARGGSKGLPNKHLLDLGGRPVLAWTAEAALASELLDRVVLTTDDEAIAQLGEQLGLDVPFRRPADLAGDDTPMADVVRHAVDVLDGDWGYVVVLQPTSPLRTASDIDEAVALCDRTGAPSCVSVSPVRQHPAWMYRVDADGSMSPLLDEGDKASRRQDLPPVFALNGAVYVLRRDRIDDADVFATAGAVAYAMPADRSVDIDTEHDLLVLRTLVTPVV